MSRDAMTRRAVGGARITERLARIAREVPAGLLLLDGALGLVAGVVGATPPDRLGASLLPVDLLDPNVLLQLTGAIATIALGVGLARRKRLAPLIATLTFGTAAFVQLVLLGHPLGAFVAVTCAGIVLLDRRSFRVRAPERARRDAIALLIGGVGFAALGVAALLVGVPTSVPSLSLVVESAVAVVSLGTPGPLDLLPSHGLAIGLVIALARLPLTLGVVRLLRPAVSRSPERSIRALAILRTHGRGALLPFQLGPAIGWFESTRDRAVVPYAVSGRFAVALGDPVGQEPDRERCWESFVATAERDDLVPSIYQASEAWAKALAEAGWHTFKVGHEAIVDLPVFDLRGSARANLRHTVARARRGGVTVEWFPNGVPAERSSLRAGLADVDAAWRSEVGPELAFTISRFGEESLSGPIAVASVDSVPIAFATFVATGSDDGYVLDLMRRVPGSTPGAFEACLAEAARGLAEMGATTLSLGLAPLAFLDARSGPLEERILSIGGRAIRRVYDVEGLAFFKRKFAPRWEPRYAVVRGHADAVGLAVALIRLHTGGVANLVRSGIAAVVPSRRTLGIRRRPMTSRQ